MAPSARFGNDAPWKACALVLVETLATLVAMTQRKKAICSCVNRDSFSIRSPNRDRILPEFLTLFTDQNSGTRAAGAGSSPTDSKCAD